MRSKTQLRNRPGYRYCNMIRSEIAGPIHREQFPGSTFRIILKGCEVFSIFRTAFDNRGFDSKDLTIRDFITVMRKPHQLRQ